MKLDNEFLKTFIALQNTYFSTNKKIDDRITYILSLIYDTKPCETCFDWCFANGSYADEENQYYRGYFDIGYMDNIPLITSQIDFSNYKINLISRLKLPHNIYNFLERVKLAYTYIPTHWLWESDDDILKEYNSVLNNIIKEVKKEIELKDKEKQKRIEKERENDLLLNSIFSKLSKEEREILNKKLK
jgi:hypothetical protein